jgi:hypothetical protein
MSSFPPPPYRCRKTNTQQPKTFWRKKIQTMCLFICNLVKDMFFVFEKYRAHKYTWLEAINFG